MLRFLIHNNADESTVDMDQTTDKIERILQLFTLGLIILGARLWHIAIVEQDAYQQLAQKPMTSTVYHHPKRGTIRDRFNIPLAVNQIQYQAAVIWSDIATLPQVLFEKTPQGKKRRLYRREYIEKFSHMLASTLSRDPTEIEDAIWSTASFYGQAPYVLEENITEQQYYKLLALSPLWPGLAPQIHSKRHYPQGRVAADIIGTMGAIDPQKYEHILEQLQQLNHLKTQSDLGELVELPKHIPTLEDLEERLKTLQDLAYTSHDLIGTSGIEKIYEEQLKGTRGKSIYKKNAKGKFLHTLATPKKSHNGSRILLTISSELQQYAESLLAITEQIRDERPLHARIAGQPLLRTQPPPIKGGAIVVIDPNTFELLTLASYPRFDPNDFIPQKSRNHNALHKWLETPKHLKDLYTEQKPLEIEYFSTQTQQFYDKETIITWNEWIDLVFPKQTPAKQTLTSIDTVGQAYTILQQAKTLLDQAPQNDPKQTLEHIFPLESQDNILIINCLRLLINPNTFPTHLLPLIGSMKLETFKSLNHEYEHLVETIRHTMEKTFRTHTFATWRQHEGKAFLKTKRIEEKEQNITPKPYTYYFQQEAKRQFHTLWHKKNTQWIDTFLTPPQHPHTPFEKDLETLRKNTHTQLINTPTDLIEAFEPFANLQKPLIGRIGSFKTLEHLALSFYPKHGFQYTRSHAYRQSTIQGSIFKLVTALIYLQYAHEHQQPLNDFSITDRVKKGKKGVTLGTFANGSPIPQLYNGGKIPRSLNKNIGPIDLPGAIEYSSNPFFALLAQKLPSGDYFAQKIRELGFGTPTHIQLPGEISGKIPHDLNNNPTGLYATAIGQHSLVVTPLQTATFLATLANQGVRKTPQITHLILSQKPNQTYHIETPPNPVQHITPIPHEIQQLLFQGMHQAMSHATTQDVKKFYPKHPELTHNPIHSQLLAKTSTSEVIEKLPVGLHQQSAQVCHTWGGMIHTPPPPPPPTPHPILFHDTNGAPKLVVVVYLRYGRLGKEALPIAACIAQKWEEIQTRHGCTHASKVSSSTP